MPCYCVVLTLDQSVATATSSTLHDACRLGDAVETQRLLDAGTNINARDQVLRFASYYSLNSLQHHQSCQALLLLGFSAVSYLYL